MAEKRDPEKVRQGLKKLREKAAEQDIDCPACDGKGFSNI